MSDKRNTKNNIRIVIIDSGINKNDPYLDNVISYELGIKFDKDMNIIKEEYPRDNNIHGTDVAKTIKFVCKDVEFISINILDENLSADGRILIKALEEAAIYKPNIIHLSLGTTKFKYWLPLKRIIGKLYKKNILIVSAASNSGRISYPAYLKNVVGVKGLDTKNYNIFSFHNNFFYASIHLPEYFIKYDKRDSCVCGTSISSAYITGHISNLILDFGLENSKEIISRLKEKANNIYEKINIK